MKIKGQCLQHMEEITMSIFSVEVLLFSNGYRAPLLFSPTVMSVTP